MTSKTVSASATATPGIFAFSATHSYPKPPSSSNPVFTVTATATDSTADSTPATEAALVVDGLQGGQAVTAAPGSNGSVQVTVGAFTGSFAPPVDGGSVVVFGGPSASAPDTITITNGLAAPVKLYGGGKDALTVQDPTSLDTITITNNSVKMAKGITVSYSHLSSLLVSGPGGGDKVTMTGIAAGVATTVDGVSGSTSFVGKFPSTGFNGVLVLNHFTTAKLTDAGNFSGSLTVNSPGNLQQLSVTGTVTAGSSISVAGTVSGGTLGTNAGTLAASAISGMSVTTNSGTISAAGAGTTSNVTIGTNTSTGLFAAVENTTVRGSGVMTSTTITSNAGTVSAGSISGMSVTVNSGKIISSGQGTTSNVTIGTNTSTGTFSAVEDTNSGSGVMSNTTITSNAGTVSAGSISTMSVSTNSGTVSAAGQGTTSNVTIGTNTSTGTFSAVEDTNSGSGVMTNTIITSNAGTVSAGSISTMSVSANSGTIRVTGLLSGLTLVSNSPSGSVFAGSASNTSISVNFGMISDAADTGTMTDTTLGSNAGTVIAGSISGMSVSANSGSISAVGPGNASDVTIDTLGPLGTLTAAATLSNLNVTVFSGLVSAGQIGTITAINAPDPSVMLNVIEGGVTRQLVLTPASGGSLPQSVSYVYDHTGGGDPQLTLAVNDGTNTGSYDVELLSSAAAAGSGFDLAALYAAPNTTAHVRNVLIEGNLTPNANDASQVGISSSVGGVQLPGVALASVGVMGNAPAGSVTAASVQAVSFASLTESGGTVSAAAATPADAAQLLAPGTAIVQANDSFLAAAGQTAQGQTQTVALFLDTGTGGAFDPNSVLFDNEGNVIAATNPVLAQVTATAPTAGAPSTIQTISLTGDGGSIQTAQFIASAITSTGAVGDLILQASQGIAANITAPSFFGNIEAPNGSISGTIQSTAGNIGMTFLTNGIITGVTSIQTPFALSGEIISAEDLISQVTVGSQLTGTIAAAGNIGAIQTTTAGFDRFGGMSIGGGFYGVAVALGNIFGDTSIRGGLHGRIAAQGAPDILGPGRQGMVGNIDIDGGVDSSAAIVSGGEIGDNGSSSIDFTDLFTTGTIKGILAAAEPISLQSTGTLKFASIFNDVGDLSSPQYDGGVNQAAIDNIFAGLAIGDLVQILINLNNLHVGSDGNLSDS